MRLTSPSVQRLLNASECTLVESASSASLKELTAARLRSKVERTRGLKDKYADLAKARGRAGRGKVQPRGAAARTDQETMAAKVEVFEAVLTRFTTQLAKVEKQAARAAAKKPRKTAQAPADGTAKRTTPRRSGPGAKKAPEASPPMTKGEARALVAKVRRRVARTSGDPAAALSDDAVPTTPSSDAEDAANTSVVARSQDARVATVEQHFAATHIARAQGHAGARTQRAQGKRDS